MIAGGTIAARINAMKDKAGNITKYKVRICLGGEEMNKQNFKTHYIPRPKGLTPAKEKKEVERSANEWVQMQKAKNQKGGKKTEKGKITFFADFVKSWE